MSRPGAFKSRSGSSSSSTGWYPGSSSSYTSSSSYASSYSNRLIASTARRSTHFRAVPSLPFRDDDGKDENPGRRGTAVSALETASLAGCAFGL